MRLISLHRNNFMPERARRRQFSFRWERFARGQTCGRVRLRQSARSPDARTAAWSLQRCRRCTCRIVL